MEIGNILKQFNVTQILTWLKEYLQFFTSNRTFWRLVFANSIAENAMRIFFYFILSIGLITLFQSKLPFAEAVRGLTSELLATLVVTLPPLFLSHFILKKKRTGANIGLELLLFVLYIKTIINPVLFLLSTCFLIFQEYNFLFIYNVILAVASSYLYVYSNFIFFKKIKYAIISCFIIFILANSWSLIINRAILVSPEANRILVMRFADPITKEILRFEDENSSYYDIRESPSHIIVWKLRDTTLQMFKNMNLFEVINIATLLDESVVDTTVEYELNFENNHNDLYLDSLEKKIYFLDSITNAFTHVAPKKYAQIISHYYKSILNLIDTPLDTLRNDIKLIARKPFIIDGKTTHIVMKEYDVGYLSVSLFKTKSNEVKNLGNRIKNAYRPYWIFDQVYYWPFHFIDRRFLNPVTEIKSTHSAVFEL
jgi:hypothetical protein